MRRRLGRILMEKRALTRSELQAALVQQQAHGGQLGEILVRMGVGRQEVEHALLVQLLEANLPADEARG